MGRTIDDVNTVSPANAKHVTRNFVEKYREVLSVLNIGAAEEDEERTKAFDCATSGEILGVWFDSERLTWTLPQRKMIPLIKLLHGTISCQKLSLNAVEIVHGRLAHLAQLAPPMKLLMGEIIQHLRDFLKLFYEINENTRKRQSQVFEMRDPMIADLKTLLAIFKRSLHDPLPIVAPAEFPGLWALRAYTDISGHLLSSPSIGIYVPSELTEKSLVASIVFPRQFLASKDSLGKNVYCKTTALEALGILTTICIDPFRFAGREAMFMNDNISTVISFKKGYSGDPWTTCIVRASRIVAAGIGASVFVVWEPRRSSHGSMIADDLTHNLLKGLNDQELQDYLELSKVTIPPPILQWMGSPGQDRCLGARILCWISREYPALKILFNKN